MARTPKRPRDPNQLAKLIVDIATGATTESMSGETGKGESRRSKAAQKAGEAGGPARSASLSPHQRSEIARKAAKTRWGDK
jgi:hypothetical protein